MESINEMLADMQFADLKKNFSAVDRERLVTSKCVSSNESSVWLIEYWCGKKRIAASYGHNAFQKEVLKNPGSSGR